MKALLSLFVILTASTLQADNYTLYSVRGDSNLFDDANDQNFISKIFSPAAIIDVFIETTGTLPGGTVRTHSVDYVQEWDASGNPKSWASRDVGTKFKVTELGGTIHYEFSDTKLERWVSISPPKKFLQPIFSAQGINGDISLDKGRFIVMGGLPSEELHDGVIRKFTRFFIMLRK